MRKIIVLFVLTSCSNTSTNNSSRDELIKRISAPCINVLDNVHIQARSINNNGSWNAQRFTIRQGARHFILPLPNENNEVDTTKYDFIEFRNYKYKSLVNRDAVDSVISFCKSVNLCYRRIGVSSIVSRPEIGVLMFYKSERDVLVYVKNRNEVVNDFWRYQLSLEKNKITENWYQVDLND